MYIYVFLLPWAARAVRLTPYRVFQASDVANWEALILSAFRGAPSRKLPQPFQSGIERIDLKQARVSESFPSEEQVLEDRTRKESVDHATPPPKVAVSAPASDAAAGMGNETSLSRWRRLLHLAPSKPAETVAAPAVNFMAIPSEEGVWDELDDLAVKTGLVHSGSRPFAFQYDIPHGKNQAANRQLWIETLNHSVLATAHEPDFPIVLALISLCGGSMLVTLITMVSSPSVKFGDIIRIMNITLYGVLGALLAMYFKVGKCLTALLTISFALLPILSATKRLPSALTKFTGGLNRCIDVETFLAVRIGVTIFSSLCVQALLSIALVVFGSDRLSEHIARHLASSQLLFAFLMSLVAAATLLPLLRELRRIDQYKLSMQISQLDFSFLNTFVHLVVSLAFGVVVIGTVSHLHNYLVFTTHKGEILLFDPLIFFVPFSTSLFRWYNLLALVGVACTAAFVFLSTAKKSWIVQLDNSFNIENDLEESLNGTLQEEPLLRETEEEEGDRELLLHEPTPRVVPPPETSLLLHKPTPPPKTSLLPPSPPSEPGVFATPLSP